MSETLKVVNMDNIEEEHICCALSKKKGDNCAGLKKAWLKERFQEGLVFLKLDVRGKVFIEYLPAEVAFVPIVAPEYMYINCFWVSGKYARHGYGSRLLEACIEDAKEKGKKGLVVLSSKKKMPFLSDPKFLKKKGFQKCDEAYEFYDLLYLSFEGGFEVPKFSRSVGRSIDYNEEIVLYYTNQCPHSEKYGLLIKGIAESKNVSFKAIKLIDAKQAQSSPAPFTTYSLFINGQFVTNEILTEKKFLGLLEKYKLL